MSPRDHLIWCNLLPRLFIILIIFQFINSPMRLIRYSYIFWSITRSMVIDLSDLSFFFFHSPSSSKMGVFPYVCLRVCVSQHFSDNHLFIFSFFNFQRNYLYNIISRRKSLNHIYRIKNNTDTGTLNANQMTMRVRSWLLYNHYLEVSSKSHTHTFPHTGVLIMCILEKERKRIIIIGWIEKVYLILPHIYRRRSSRRFLTVDVSNN